jgi:hypothetical protein
VRAGHQIKYSAVVQIPVGLLAMPAVIKPPQKIALIVPVSK